MYESYRNLSAAEKKGARLVSRVIMSQNELPPLFWPHGSLTVWGKITDKAARVELLDHYAARK
jgi:hypothetical protein